MDKKQYEIYHEQKKHTPDDFPYNTYLCSIPLDFRSVKLHWHSEVEIIVIKKGTGIVSVDLISYSVSSGDIIFVFPGQLHSIHQKDSSIMEYENILFKPGLLKSSGHDLYNDKLVQTILSGVLPIRPLIDKTCSYYDSIDSSIREIDRLCDVRPYAYQLSVKACLFQIFYILISFCGENKVPAIHNKSLEQVKKILTFIADHFSENITIEQVAEHCCYSKSYFMKFFKENMGVSFVAYLNDYRLELASKMLTDTSDNIVDIAFNTGFDNLSYFTRCFKRKYGLTPGKYRCLSQSKLHNN